MDRLGASAFIYSPAAIRTSPNPEPSNHLCRFRAHNRTRCVRAKLNVESRVPEPLETDVIIIGSGLGGLCCGAVLAKLSDLNITVLEAHDHLGGCAHEFKYGPYTFESGPSLYSGFYDLDLNRNHHPSGNSANPLMQIFELIGYSPQWIKYDRWGVYLPGGNQFSIKLGYEQWKDVILKKMDSSNDNQANQQWDRLINFIKPISESIRRIPSTLLRNDPWSFILLMAKYPKEMISAIQYTRILMQPFRQVLDKLSIADPFIRNWINLLCFLLQGRTLDATPTSVISFMLAEWYFDKSAVLDYPQGGSGAMVDALVRGILHPKRADDNGRRTPNRVFTRSRVKEILIDPQSRQATGVVVERASDKSTVIMKARKAVVSNADVYQTRKMIPNGLDRRLDQYLTQFMNEKTSTLPSFIHLHAVIDTEGLPSEATADFPAQWCSLESWDLEQPRNLVLVSVPSLLDPSLSPVPKTAVIHAYTPATEPYEPWVPFRNDRSAPEYLQRKAEAADFLWKAVEKQIPNARQRCKFELVGTPLTHERFLNRYRGTYGTALQKVGDMLPWHTTPITNLYLCSDSTGPGGIGVPATSCHGAIVANTIIAPREYLNAYQ